MTTKTNPTIFGRLGRLIPVIALMVLFGVNAGFSEPPNKAWITDLTAAKERAAADKKPLLVMFSASWCPPCKFMKSDVLPQPQVVEELKQYTLAYIDIDTNQADAEAMEIEVLPTYVVIDPKEGEVGRFSQAQPKPEDFIKALRNVHKFHTSLKEIDQQLEKTPTDPALWKRKGDLLSENNLLEKGLEAYQKASDLDPNNTTGVAADLAFFKAMNLLDTNMTEGSQALEGVAAKYPKSARVEDVMYTQALIALHQEDNLRAKTILSTYQQKYPRGKFNERIERLLTVIKQVEEAKAQESATGQ